jgi:hypothetical protein
MHRSAALAVAALLVLSGVVAPLAAADPTDESASFGESVVTVTRGDTVEISVKHSTEANLTIGSQDAGFEVRIPLGGSGSKTIRLDTYATDSANPGDFLNTGGTLQTRPLSEAIEAGRYDMEITIDGVTQALGNLIVRERGETTGAARIMPGGFAFEDRNVGGVLGGLTARDRVAKGDYAAFLVNESGLSWAFPEKASLDAGLADGLTAELVELDPEPNTRPEEFDGDVFRVVSAVPDSDQFVLLWDTDSVDVASLSNNTYRFRLELTADSALTTETRTLVEERVRVVKPRVSLTATPGFTLAPWDDKQLMVSGQTNLAPGTTLDVRARQQSPRSKLWRTLAEVGPNGAFDAEFRFARAAVPGEFPLWVLGYESQSRETVALTESSAAVSFPNQTVSDGAVTVRNVSLSNGGFVRVTGNGSILGTSPYLQAGDREAVTVPLAGNLSGPTNATATVIADANRNATLDDGDVPFEVNGSVVRANATVEPAPEPDPEPTTTTRNTTTATTTTTTATTSTATATTTQRNLDTEDSPPLAPAAQGDAGGSSGGFVGLSPVLALAALAAAGALAARQ